MFSNSLGGVAPPSSGHTHHHSSHIHRQNSGTFYPRKVTYTLAALKIICGCALVVLGTLALYQKASYARTAAGLWGGIIVIISGVLGIFSVRSHASRYYVLSFFVACVIALISDVLVIIYSATGLARDSGFPGGFVKDELTGDLIPVSEVNIPAREHAMLVNLVLIILGVLDILFTLPSFIICLREVCECYSPLDYAYHRQQHINRSFRERSPRNNNNDWLLAWLGQQNQVYFSGASGVPYQKIPAFAAAPPTVTPPFVFIPSELSQSSSKHHHHHHQRRSMRKHNQYDSTSPSHSRRSSNPHQHSSRSYRPKHYAPMELYATPHHFYFSPGSYPSPGSNISHPSLAPLVPVHASSPHQWIYGDMNTNPFLPRHHHNHHHQRSSSRNPYHSSRPKRRRSRSEGRTGVSDMEHRNKKKKNSHSGSQVKSGPTDSDLERTYTGLDRELAEEFIEQTMDPTVVLEHKKQYHFSNNNNNNNVIVQPLQPPPKPPPMPHHLKSSGSFAPSMTESEAW